MQPIASEPLPSGEDENGVWIRGTILDAERGKISFKGETQPGVCFRDFPCEIIHFLSDEISRQCDVAMEALQFGREIAYRVSRDSSWENINAVRLGSEPTFAKQCEIRAWLLKEKVIMKVLELLNRAGHVLGD